MESKNTTDKLLKSFFDENKQVIDNNGFTNKVMVKLPETANHEWIVWIFGAIGLSIALYIGLKSDIINTLFFAIKQINYYYIIGGLFLFPIVSIVTIFVKLYSKIRFI